MTTWLLFLLRLSAISDYFLKKLIFLIRSIRELATYPKTIQKTNFYVQVHFLFPVCLVFDDMIYKENEPFKSFIGRKVKDTYLPGFWNFWAFKEDSVLCVWDPHTTSSDTLQMWHGPNVIKVDCKAVLVKYSTWCEWNNMDFSHIKSYTSSNMCRTICSFCLWLGKCIFYSYKIITICYLSIMISHAHKCGDCINWINLYWYFLEIWFLPIFHYEFPTVINKLPETFIFLLIIKQLILKYSSIP